MDAQPPRTPSLGRSAAVMAVGTTLSRVTGLGRLVAAAYALGVTESRLADTYNIANTVPNVIYELVLGGVLTSVFIPIVVEELRTKPRKEAWEAVSSLVTTALVVLTAISVLAFLAAPAIIRLFTMRLEGGEAAEQQHLATVFLRFFAPQIVLYGYAAVAAGLLNAHDRFAVPMFVPVLNNVVVIGVFVAFAQLVSGTPTVASVSAAPSQELLLALGTTMGVAVMALANWPFVRRLPGRLRFRPRFRDPAVRKLARLSLWTFGYVVTNQLAFGVALVLANGVQGGPTAYFTAFAFFQLPYGIAAVSIMTALVPTLSAQYVDHDDAGFRARTAGGIRAMALLMLPATAGYLVLSRPLIQTLLERGVMQAESSALVASVLDTLALGLLPFSAFLLLLRAFYARQDTRTPLFANVISNVAYLIASFALFPLLDVRGLGLSHTLCYVVAALLAGRWLGKAVGGLDGRHTARELAKMTAAAAVSAGAMLAAVWIVSALVGPGNLRALLQLGFGGAVGLASYVAAAWVLRVEDLAVFRRLLPRRLRVT
ncbi:MAG TPA: murein biosynthesis integral membrane protein MurJ [Acidimicrobiales bacterium]|nr:murein biosynthesis integral membrane protein MurJ [Acidimicrobiales bacterium]